MKLFKLNDNNKRSTLIKLAVIVALLIGLNIISNYVHFGIDLTEEHRFSITKETKTLLKNLKEPVHIKLLLRGGAPANFEKLRGTSKDLLVRFRDLSGGKITFENTDPIAGITGDKLTQAYKNLAMQGAQPIPTRSQLDDKQKTEEQIIFPYAVVNGNGKEFTVPLVEYHTGMAESEFLNYSESLLEYKLATAIQNLFKQGKERVAWIMGQGEALGDNTYDALTTLESLYEVDTIDLGKSYYIPPMVKCAIICQPRNAFSEQDKFKLDQFVMAGGKLLWFVDACNVNIDTLQQVPNYTVIPHELNITDMLFKYGIRLNSNLVEDLSANPIPVVTGGQNGRPQQQMFKWVYFPVFSSVSKHPVVNNLDAVMSKFCGTIDTIENEDNVKHVLLSTSIKSRAIGAPISVSLNSLQYQLKPSLYNKRFLPTAVCIEGKFRTNYANGIDPSFKAVYEDSLRLKFREVTDSASKMIVVADADIILNDFHPKKGPSDMGLYKFTKEYFANKTFFLNCVEYLVHENNMLASRNKEVKLRLLNSDKVAAEKTMWQSINIILPITLVVLFGGLYWFFRKKRYEITHKNEA
jgi:ABC-2 type transport system permease protein